MNDLRQIIKYLNPYELAQYASQEADAKYWRERIYDSMMAALLAWGLLALIPSVWLAIRADLSFIALVDILAYGLACTFFVYRKHFAYRTRAIAFLVIGYLLGIIVFIAIGDEGSGLYWLFAVPPIASLLLGLRGGLVFSGLVFFTMVAIGGLIAMDMDALVRLNEFTVAAWVVYALNFLAANALVTVPLGALLDGLFLSIKRERRSKELAEAVIETTNVIFMQIDRSGQIMRINAAAGELLGYRQDEMEGQHWITAMIPERHRDQARAYFEQILAAEERSAPIEGKVVTKGGEERVILWKSSLVREGEEVSGFMSFGLDITDQRMAEEEILSLSKFPEENPHPVIRIAENGILLYANRASQLILEKWQSAEGQPVPDEWRQTISEVLTSRQLLRKEIAVAGRIFALSVTPVPENRYVNLYGLDVTQQKEAEARIQQRLADLEAIRQVSTKLRESNQLDEMLFQLLTSTLEALNAQTGSIWLYDKASHELRIAVDQGYGDTSAIKPEKPGEGLSGAVFARGETFVSEDFHTDLRVPAAVRSLIPKGIGGVVVPIRSDTDKLGVINVNTELPRVISQAEINLLVTLTEIAGNSIQRAMLHQETERHLQRLLALAEIDNAIS